MTEDRTEETEQDAQDAPDETPERSMPRIDYAGFMSAVKSGEVDVTDAPQTGYAKFRAGFEAGEIMPWFDYKTAIRLLRHGPGVSIEHWRRTQRFHHRIAIIATVGAVWYGLLNAAAWPYCALVVLYIFWFHFVVTLRHTALYKMVLHAAHSDEEFFNFVKNENALRIARTDGKFLINDKKKEDGSGGDKG